MQVMVVCRRYSASPFFQEGDKMPRRLALRDFHRCLILNGAKAETTVNFTVWTRSVRMALVHGVRTGAFCHRNTK